MLEARIEVFSITDAPRRVFREWFGQPVNFVQQPAVAQVGVQIDNRHNNALSRLWKVIGRCFAVRNVVQVSVPSKRVARACSASEDNLHEPSAMGAAQSSDLRDEKILSRLPGGGSLV